MSAEDVKRYKDTFFDKETGLFSYPVMRGVTNILVKDIVILGPLIHEGNYIGGPHDKGPISFEVVTKTSGVAKVMVNEFGNASDYYYDTHKSLVECWKDYLKK